MTPTPRPGWILLWWQDGEQSYRRWDGEEIPEKPGAWECSLHDTQEEAREAARLMAYRHASRRAEGFTGWAYYNRPPKKLWIARLPSHPQSCPVFEDLVAAELPALEQWEAERRAERRARELAAAERELESAKARAEALRDEREKGGSQ